MCVRSGRAPCDVFVSRRYSGVVPLALPGFGLALTLPEQDSAIATNEPMYARTGKTACVCVCVRVCDRVCVCECVRVAALRLSGAPRLLFGENPRCSSLAGFGAKTRQRKAKMRALPLDVRACVCVCLSAVQCDQAYYLSVCVCDCTRVHAAQF